jgi:hypothetical protein
MLSVTNQFLKFRMVSCTRVSSEYIYHLSFMAHATVLLVDILQRWKSLLRYVKVDIM